MIQVDDLVLSRKDLGLEALGAVKCIVKTLGYPVEDGCHPAVSSVLEASLDVH